MTLREQRPARSWTPAEDAIVASSYATLGAAYVARETGRTLSSVYHRAVRLGVITKRRWTTEDRQRLENLWGEHSLADIATKLGRSPSAVHWQATEVQGLHSAAQPGFEHLAAAAARTGFHFSTFRRILKWAGVRIWRPMSRPGFAKQLRRCVDSDEVDAAVKSWLEAETVEAAARARGVTHHKIRGALARLSEMPKKPRGKRHWRIATSVIDAALAGDRRAA